MKWLPYIFLSYIALGLQIGLGDTLSFHDGPPNFVLLAVVYMCLSMPKKPALIGSFLIGLTQDFLSQHPAGLYAFSYGLTAMIIRGTHQVVYGHHPLSHIALTLIGGIVTAAVLGLDAVLHPAAARIVEADAVLPAMRYSAWPAIISAVYTALLAPGLLWILEGRHNPRLKRLTATSVELKKAAKVTKWALP